MEVSMQSVIVYRNPAEAAFWEAMSSANVIPIALAALCFIVVFTTTNSVFDKLLSRKRGFALYKWEMPFHWIIAGTAAVVTFKYFYLG